MNEYNKGYDEGFQQGLAASEFTDGYWLRCYAGQAMQGILASNTTSTGIEALPSACVYIAKALLKELEHELEVLDGKQ